MSGIAAAVTWTTIFKQRNRPLPRDPMPDHERVYDAVASRDATAARESMAELVRLALLDTTGEEPGRSRTARRAKRRSWRARTSNNSHT
jgi:DNA-binding FadR family transcriptional regulator